MPLATPLLTRTPVVIAVVDDDEGCRGLLALLLQRMGYLCETYDSVRSLVNAHALRRIRCIILDYAMPEIDGLTAQKGIRKTNYTGPIIFCSGYDDQEIQDAALGAGAAYYLRKPLTKQSLIKALETVALAPQVETRDDGAA